jgi:thiamine biosynthesis lipoprotein
VTGKLEDLNTFDTLSFEAMNTSFYIAVSNYKFGNWKEAIQGWVHYVEQEWSRFQPNNELGKINQMEIGEKISLSPPLFDVSKRRKTIGGGQMVTFHPIYYRKCSITAMNSPFRFKQANR